VKYFLSIFLLAVSVMADTEITSLPCTLSVARETYYLNTDLYCETGASFYGSRPTAIIIADSGIILDGQNHTVYFNLSDDSAEWGMYPADVPACSVLNLTIEQDTGKGGGCGVWNQCIRVGGTTGGFTLSNCNVHARGNNSSGVWAEGIVGLNIEGGNYTSYVDSFTERTSNDVACIRAVVARAPSFTAYWYVNDSSIEYNVRVAHITIDSFPHTGINVEGKYFIDSNTINGDAHNDFYPYPEGSGVDKHSSEDAFAIGADWGQGYRHIVGNTITSGSNHRGCRGMYIGHDSSAISHDSSATHCLIIADNDVTTHIGWGEESDWDLDGFGIRLRGYTSEYLDNACIYNNNIYVEANGDTTDLTITEGAVGFNLSFSGTGLRVYDNNVRVFYDTTGFNSTENYLRVYALQLYTGLNAKDTDNIIYDNYLSSNSIGVLLGGDNGACEYFGSGKNTLFLRNTIVVDSPGIAWISNRNDDSGAIATETHGCYAQNIIFQDMLYPYDSLIMLDPSGTDSTELRHRRSVKFLIEDSSGHASNGASYTVINDSGDTVLSGTTGATGLIQNHLDYYITAYVSSQVDTAYNPFIITATKDNDTIADTLDIYSGTAVEGDSVTATLTFTALSPSPSYNQISGTFFQGLEIRK